MLRHLFRYTPQMMLFNRDGVLFGILFPFAFGIIYLFVFTGLLSGGNNLDTIPVAMVFEGSTEEVSTVQNNLTGLANPAEISDNNLVLIDDSGEDPLMMYVEVDSLEEGRELADQGLVDATIIANNEEGSIHFSIEVSPSAVNNFTSSIIYSALNSYQSINYGIETAYAKVVTSPNPITSLTTLNQRLEDFQQDEYLIVDQTDEDSSSSFNIYFYAAIAYICIFFMSSGVQIVTDNEANFSNQALRATMAPIPKAYRFLVTFVSWAVPSILIVNFVILLYFMNGVSLGNDPGKVVLIATLGTLVGLLMGTTIAAVLKSNMNLMQAIAIGLPLVLGAFSGLMSAGLKVMVNENFPWFNKINPVNLINDGIYYLNNYPTNEAYYQNVFILATFVVILLSITLIGLRRTDYERL